MFKGIVVLLALSAQGLFAQGSLMLSSASSIAGAPVNLSLSWSAPATTGVASMQWTLAYTSGQISSISVTAGQALSAAGKSLSCNNAPGALTCIAFGLNATKIANGEVAIVTVAPLATAAIGVSKTLGVTPDAAAVPINGNTASLALVAPPAIASVACSPSSITSGGQSTCSVALSTGALAGGLSVALTSSNPALTVPSNVLIPAGATSATFTASAGAVTQSVSATVTASAGGSGQVTVLTIQSPMPSLTGVTCTPSRFAASGTAPCLVTLSEAATQPTTVALTADNANVSIPASVVIAAGSQTAYFQAAVKTVQTDQVAHVTASANGASVATTITLQASLMMVSGVSCAPSSIQSESDTTCTVTLTGMAPASGASVALSANNSILSIPAVVTVQAGANTASFRAVAGPVATGTAVMISAAGGGSSVSIFVTVAAAPALSSVTCNPSAIVGTGSTQCTLTLTSATAASLSATLKSTSPNLLVPASVTIPAGAGSVTFSANSASVTTNETVNLTAQAGSTAVSATITLAPPPVLTSVQCLPAVTAATTTTCSVTFASAVPADTVVNITTSNSGVQVPTSVTIPASAVNSAFAASVSSTAGPQNATVSAAYGGVTKTVSINLLASDIRFYLRLQPSEISGVTNGSSITPAIGSASLSGRVLTTGTGSVQFDASGVGAAFLPAGPQISNKALFRFGAPDLASIFGDAGEISFSLKSRYSLRDRRALATPNARWVFDLVDSGRRLFFFQVQTSGSRLRFSYQTGGAITTFIVPIGQEDLLFGKGVTAKFRIIWNKTGNSLYLNDQSVMSQSYAATGLVWSGAAPSLTVGATDPASPDAGAYSSDDTISDFKVVRVNSADIVTTLTPKSMAVPSIVRGSSFPDAAIVTEGIQNAVTGSREIVCGPDSAATIYGHGFTDPGRLYTDPSGSSIDASGVRVLVNGVSAPVLYASETDITFACPAAVAGTKLDVMVQTVSATTSEVVVHEADRAIGILGGETEHEVMTIRAIGLTEEDSRTTRVLLNGRVATPQAIVAVPGLLGVRELQVRVTPEETNSSVQILLDRPNGEPVTSNVVSFGIAAERERGE